MTIPDFYIVADGQAFAIDGDDMYGAPITDDGVIEWDSAYDFYPEDDDEVEYVAHMCYYLKQAQQLTIEHQSPLYQK